MLKKKRGLSVAELIIAMGFLSVILMISTSLFSLGAMTVRKSKEEFELQSGVRVASEIVTQKIRYSTVIFTVPEKFFKVWDDTTEWNNALNAVNTYDTSKLTREWSYLGVVDVNINGQLSSSIVNFVWDATINAPIGGWIAETVLAPKEGVRYTLNFKKTTAENEDNVLGFTLNGLKNNNDYITVDSDANALNALQVMTLAGNSEKAAAISYRNDSRPEHRMADVALVLDCSNSMGGVVGGASRLVALKAACNTFITGIAGNENINVVLAPFGTNANTVGQFRNMGDVNERADILADITALSLIGGTNTGDGLRRGYHRIREHNEANSTTNFKNYLVLFSDGGTTYYTVKATLPGAADYNTFSIMMLGYNAAGTRYVEIGKVNQWLDDVNFQDDNFYLDDGDLLNGQLYQFNAATDIEEWMNNYVDRVPGSNATNLVIIPPDDAANRALIAAGQIANEMGPGSGEDRSRNSFRYIAAVANLFPNQDIEVFFVVFPGDSRAVLNANYLGIDVTDSTHYFRVDNPAQMAAAFGEIANTINNQFWHVAGPEFRE